MNRDELFEKIATGNTADVYDDIEYMKPEEQEDALCEVAAIADILTRDDIANVLQDAKDRLEGRIEDLDRVWEDELSEGDKTEISQRIETLSEFADRLESLIDDCTSL